MSTAGETRHGDALSMATLVTPRALSKPVKREMYRFFKVEELNAAVKAGSVSEEFARVARTVYASMGRALGGGYSKRGWRMRHWFSLAPIQTKEEADKLEEFLEAEGLPVGLLRALLESGRVAATTASQELRPQAEADFRTAYEAFAEEVGKKHPVAGVAAATAAVGRAEGFFGWLSGRKA